LDQLLQQKVNKPKAIKQVLRDAFTENHPTSKQITNYLYQYRKMHFGKSRILIGELEEWCLKRSALPKSEDEVLIRYKIEVHSKDSISFFIVGTTKRLLKMLIRNKHIVIDATYNLNYQGYPLVVGGTTDFRRKLHPAFACLVSNETHVAYGFIFSTIKQLIKEVCTFDYKPTNLIADGADAISNGFQEAFGPKFKRGMCWFHVMKNVKDHLDESHPDYEKILEDLSTVQYSRNEECFKLGFKLFKSKWDRKFPEFLQYFEKEWIKQHSGWYEGFAPGIPSSNNAVEGTNKWIKWDVTNYERLPFGRFITVFEKDLIVEWSRNHKEGDPYEQIFYEEPEIKTEDYQKAFFLSIENRSVGLYTKPGKQFFAISGKDMPAVKDFEKEVEEFVKEIKKPQWTTFKQYASKMFRISIVDFNEKNWKLSSCTCPPYSKKYICKHVIYIAVRNKVITFPASAKAIEIPMKSTQGRPAKAKPALQRQDDTQKPPAKKRKI
jgi:hypothetical protein